MTSPGAAVQVAPGVGGVDEIAFGPFRLRPGLRTLEAGGTPVRLGSRALDLLIHLASSAGAVLTHRELKERVWAGAHVEESNLRFQVGQLRRALAEHAQEVAYVTSVAGRGYCFTGHVSRSMQGSRDARDRIGLPLSLARIVGRQAEIGEIAKSLDAYRLVTVVGPGGVGKTTVAVATAHRLASGSFASAFFVDLAPLDGSGSLSDAVASALGIAAGSGDRLPELTHLLAGNHTLLVLDNCEHVIDAAALFAETILSRVAGIRILATSREPLRVAGEVVHRLRPLELPPPQADPIDALAYPAVELFVSRAALQRQELILAGSGARLAARICHRLDGIPLAIELAAGAVASLGLAGLAELLEIGSGTAEIGRRTALPRHRSLRASLDWSYGLLTAREAAMLRNLSVFTGQFTLAAALFVATGDRAPTDDHLARLTSLVEKSLVIVDVGVNPARYRILETTRLYTGQKLSEARESLPAARRHATYYAVVLERALRAPDAPTDTGRTAIVAEDMNDIQAALGWSFGPSGDPGLGMRLAASVAPLFPQLAKPTDGSRWTAVAAAAPATERILEYPVIGVAKRSNRTPDLARRPSSPAGSRPGAEARG